MANDKEAETAVAGINGTQLGARNINVNEARTRVAIVCLTDLWVSENYRPTGEYEFLFGRRPSEAVEVVQECRREKPQWSGQKRPTDVALRLARHERSALQQASSLTAVRAKATGRWRHFLEVWLANCYFAHGSPPASILHFVTRHSAELLSRT